MDNAATKAYLYFVFLLILFIPLGELLGITDSKKMNAVCLWDSLQNYFPVFSSVCTATSNRRLFFRAPLAEQNTIMTLSLLLWLQNWSPWPRLWIYVIIKELSTCFMWVDWFLFLPILFILFSPFSVGVQSTQYCLEFQFVWTIYKLYIFIFKVFIHI